MKMKKLILIYLILALADYTKTTAQTPYPVGMLPDLVVSTITDFKLAYENTQVEYTYKVSNLQNTPCNKKVALQGYWSKDSKLSTDDLPSGGTTVGPILKGAPVTGKFTMNIPNPVYYPSFKGWTLPQMLKYYPFLILMIDSNKVQPESNEVNNSLAVKHGL
jgi:CARDB